MCPLCFCFAPGPLQVKLADDVAKRSKPPAPKPELPQFLQTLQYQARRRAQEGDCWRSWKQAAVVAVNKLSQAWGFLNESPVVVGSCRRGVQLHILSPGMEKRRTNSTR